MKTETKLAKRILEVIPPVMAQVREELRASCSEESDLSVPQLRVMASINRGREFVGDIAKHQGVSQPAMSKMVDCLVARGLVERQLPRKDRRQVPLKLSKKGAALHGVIRERAMDRISEQRLPVLNEEEQTLLVEALDILERAFLRPKEK